MMVCSARTERACRPTCEGRTIEQSREALLARSPRRPRQFMQQHFHEAFPYKPTHPLTHMNQPPTSLPTLCQLATISARRSGNPASSTPSCGSASAGVGGGAEKSSMYVGRGAAGLGVRVRAADEDVGVAVGARIASCHTVVTLVIVVVNDTTSLVLDICFILGCTSVSAPSRTSSPSASKDGHGPFSPTVSELRPPGVLQ